MAKKRRNKRRKKTPVSAQRDSSLEIRKEEEKASLKKQRKSLWYLIPVFALLIGALLFYLLHPRNRIKRDSSLNVLIITLDTLRADRVGCYGYSRGETPRLDELAHNGVRFENAVCQVPLTLPSHSSIFTGLYPLYHQVRDNGSYYLDERFKTLAEIFKEREYQTAAFIGAFPVDSRFGLSQGFDVYEDKFKEEEKFKNFNSERRAEEVFHSFKGWLSKNFNHKFFAWVHYYDPHFPYEPPSPYKEKFSDPYDGEVAYSDFYVGEIMDLLKEKNIADKTLVVIASDHGEGLGEHKELDHGFFLYDTTIKVLLIFYAAQNLPPHKVVSAQARLIDIFPSVLDMLRIPISKEVQGKSLVPYIEGREEKDLVSYIETIHPREMFKWAELKGVVNGKMKFIDAPKPELYDLKEDPEEKNNLYLEDKEIGLKMKKELDNLIAKFSSTMTSRRELSSAEREKLAALGYVGNASSQEGKSSDLPDPKDKVEIWYNLQVAKGLQRRGENKKAEELYKKGIIMEPNCSLNYLFLGELYMKANRLQEAYEVFKKGAKALPEYIPLHEGLAKASVQLGKYQEALKECQAALAINDRYFNALALSGVIYDTLGEQEKAIDYLQRALAIEPENKLLLLDYAQVLATSGRAEEAVEVYKRLKTDYPDDFMIYQYLGITYGNMGKMEESIESLKRAISLRPTALAFFNLAVALEKTGNIKEAAHYMKEYLRTTPEGDTPRKRNAQQKLALWEKE